MLKLFFKYISHDCFVILGLTITFTKQISNKSVVTLFLIPWKDSTGQFLNRVVAKTWFELNS